MPICKRLLEMAFRQLHMLLSVPLELPLASKLTAYVITNSLCYVVTKPHDTQPWVCIELTWRLVKTQPRPTPGGFCFMSPWGGTREFAPPASSQVMSILLVWGAHFENHCHKQYMLSHHKMIETIWNGTLDSLDSSHILLSRSSWTRAVSIQLTIATTKQILAQLISYSFLIPLLLHQIGPHTW